MMSYNINIYISLVYVLSHYCMSIMKNDKTMNNAEGRRRISCQWSELVVDFAEFESFS